MDDRSDGGPAWTRDDRKSPRQRVNLTLRWLGIILPLVLSFPAFPWLSWLGLERGGLSGFRVRMGLGAAIWIGFTAVLVRRRDWQGAVGISLVYLVLETWWWIFVLGVLHFD
jgi:hypothetical protein